MNKQKQAKAPVAANENIIDNLDLLWQENETARKSKLIYLEHFDHATF